MSAATRRLSFAAYCARDYGNNLSVDFGQIEALTAQQVHAARMQIALHGGQDVAELLDMCGVGRDVAVRWET